jgi:hypothetical protein
LFKQSEVLDPYRTPPEYTFVWDIDRNVLQDYINRFMAGEWPQPSTDEGPTCPPPEKP